MQSSYAFQRVTSCDSEWAVSAPICDMANQDRDQPFHEYLTMNKPGVEIPGSNDYANCVFATRNLFLRVQRSINYFWIISVNLALRENLSSV